MHGLSVDGMVFPKIGYLTFIISYLFFTNVRFQSTAYLPGVTEVELLPKTQANNFTLIMYNLSCTFFFEENSFVS